MKKKAAQRTREQAGGVELWGVAPSGGVGAPRYGGVTALKYPRGNALPRARAGVCKSLR